MYRHRGQCIHWPVAMFTDANTAAIAADFSANIDFGDGSSGPGIITRTGPGTFSVSATHTWVLPGTPAVAVTVTGAGGGTGNDTLNAAVTPADLALTAGNITATEGVSYSGPVAHFTDGDPLSVAGDFTVTIDWGDGTSLDSSTGTVVADNVNGGFIVNECILSITRAPCLYRHN